MYGDTVVYGDTVLLAYPLLANFANGLAELPMERPFLVRVIERLGDSTQNN